MNFKELLKYIIYDFGNFMELRVEHIVLFVILLLLGKLLGWAAHKYIFRPNFERLNTSLNRQKSIRRWMEWICYIFALYVVIYEVRTQIGTAGKEMHADSWAIFVERGLLALILLMGFQIGIWLLNRVFLHQYFNRKEVDIGRRYTITRLVMYVGYTIAIFSILSTLNFPLTWLVGSSAALLVGLGLGLQQTFNDLISGVIILIEGTVEVGDIVTVDNFVGKVRQIGLRTSKVETRDAIVIIIPNSKLVVENVNNWSHDHTTTTRFQVNVGVSYSADVELVEKLLLQAAKEHEKVLRTPKPRVQFIDFGSSSLDFILHFFCEDFFGVEFVKSEIRFKIMALFRANEIEIPFPQRDLWIRNPEDLKND